MSPLATCCLVAAAAATAPSGEEILAKIADTGSRRQTVAYSGRREYRLRNARFAQQATVFVRMTHRPREGKNFTVLERSGSQKLASIVEKLLASEADASKPANRNDHEISPFNYTAHLRGTGWINGLSCYVLDITPKHKSRFAIQGTLWVERGNYGVVRLEGSPSASVSRWVGRPQIVQEFSEVEGLWLPTYVRSISSGFLLGSSELEIRYSDYRIMGGDASVSPQRGF
jgi:hypothetical protein